MTGEYWKMNEIANAKMEKLEIHLEEYKSNHLEVKNVISEGKAENSERNLTTAKGKKLLWSILRSRTTNRSVYSR